MNWQEKLALIPHPEGGYFRRIYAAQCSEGERPVASSIHYLLTHEQPRGRFHRVRSTILHFLQSGGPVQYACIGSDGVLHETTLGFAAGQAIVLEVPAGTWKCSRLMSGADHALVSEVVVPAFEWAEHEYLDMTQLPQRTQRSLCAQGWL